MPDLKGLVIAVAVLATGLAVGTSAERPQEPEAQDDASAEQIPLQIPQEARDRKNPVPPSTESVEYGKLIFSSQCVMCHGANGDGTGVLVERLGLDMPDFTDPQTLKQRTDGELFYILTEGHARMPGQGERFKDKVKWDLVNFARTLSSP